MRGRRVTLTRDGAVVERHAGRRSARVRRRLPAPLQAAPPPPALRFAGGVAGYFGYDTVRYIEPQAARRPEARSARAARDPAAALRGARGRRQPLGKAAPGGVRGSGAARRVRRSAAHACRSCARGCATTPGFRRTRPSRGSRRRAPTSARPRSTPRSRKAKRYITDGDIMQVQVSQRLSQPFARLAR